MKIVNLVALGLVAPAMIAAAAIGPVFSAQDAAPDAVEEPTYTVEDGRVDPATYEGYRVYTGVCMPCHGPDGLGSSFAPSLVRAVQRRPYEYFWETVHDGRQILPGQVMPGFADDEQVMAHVEDIYRYLKARADGAIGRGRPRVIGSEG
jgi:mono/diheme cytochrome c family protein